MYFLDLYGFRYFMRVMDVARPALNALLYYLFMSSIVLKNYTAVLMRILPHDEV